MLFLWMVVPLAMTLWFSAERYNLLEPGRSAYAGWVNYRDLLTHRALWVAMGNTLLLVGLVLAITLTFGTLFCLLLDQDFPGRNICRLLVIAPFFVMPTVSALIWKNMLMNPVFGLFAWITRSLGFGAIEFFSRMPLVSIVLIVGWEWTPFAVLILLPALQSLNPEQVQAARLDGAGPLALFRHIQLPHMLRPIAVVAMIEMIFLLSLFAEIYVTTGGGPGLASTNLAYLIFRDALLGWDVGRASAGGVIAIILANIVALFLMRVVGRNLEDSAMRSTGETRWGLAIAGWAIALGMFFPILWMFLTSFKTEITAVATPPALFFHPTLANYYAVLERADYLAFATNSIVVSLGSTLLALALAIPAAYSLAFFPTPRTRDILLWMLSTKMLPAVGVLVPIYLLWRDLGLLDTVFGLILIDSISVLPIVVWMLFSFFREVPAVILEASRMDGATQTEELIHVLLPLCTPGIAATALLSIILCWNEAFWSLNLTTVKAATLTAFTASFSSPEGLFWAKLSAASTLSIAPILIFGWISERQMVRGLSFGAVK